jgi:hypothetical protein
MDPSTWPKCHPIWTLFTYVSHCHWMTTTFWVPWRFCLDVFLPSLNLWNGLLPINVQKIPSNIAVCQPRNFQLVDWQAKKCQKAQKKAKRNLYFCWWQLFSGIARLTAATQPEAVVSARLGYHVSLANWFTYNKCLCIFSPVIHVESYLIFATTSGMPANVDTYFKYYCHAHKIIAIECDISTDDDQYFKCYCCAYNKFAQ